MKSVYGQVTESLQEIKLTQSFLISNELKN